MISILKKSWQFWFEWGITALLIVGVILTAFNIYPANLYILLISNLGWVAQAVMWKKYSLFIVQLVITCIYIVGIVSLFL